MTPEAVAKKIQNACIRRPELVYKQWPKMIEGGLPGLHEFQGFCYIATEAFCHVMNRAGINAQPFCDWGRTHFWACINDTVWDLTADQFDYEYPYHDGRSTRFKLLSKRASELLTESGLR